MKAGRKEIAISLRKQGKTYGEILKLVPVTKSTLSLWLRYVELSEKQKRAILRKRRDGQLKGARARHEQRIRSTETIVAQSKQDIQRLSDREKLLIGACLYWAEGTKQKNGSWSAGVLFANSDPDMVYVFQRWLTEVIRLPHSRLKYELYVHKNHAHRLLEIRRKWAAALKISPSLLGTVYFKENIVSSNRKNQGNAYYGLVRIRVRASTNLNRRVIGWIRGIVENWGVV